MTGSQKSNLKQGNTTIIKFQPRKNIIEELYNHPEVVRMKSLACSYFWWFSLEKNDKKLSNNVIRVKLTNKFQAQQLYIIGKELDFESRFRLKFKDLWLEYIQIFQNLIWKKYFWFQQITIHQVMEQIELFRPLNLQRAKFCIHHIHHIQNQRKEALSNEKIKFNYSKNQWATYGHRITTKEISGQKGLLYLLCKCENYILHKHIDQLPFCQDIIIGIKNKESEVQLS